MLGGFIGIESDRMLGFQWNLGVEWISECVFLVLMGFNYDFNGILHGF